MDDLVAEAVAFFNEVREDDEFDLAVPLVWGYVLGPLQKEQVEKVTALLRERGFADIAPQPAQDDTRNLELRFTELLVHTADSFVERVRGLAEFAAQHGCEIADWSIETPSESAGERGAAVATPQESLIRWVRRRIGYVDPQTPLTAAAFTFPFQADLARFRLELEGIPARLADEHVAGWCWKYSGAVGGVKVLVRAQDLVRALEILYLDGRVVPLSESGPAGAGGESVPTAPPLERWVCPRCHARVPGGFSACWACGTTAEGAVDPAFTPADAPVVEYDLSEPLTKWWPLICILCLPLAIYEILLHALPEGRPEGPAVRPRVLLPLDPRLRRACFCAVLGIGFCLPLCLVSLWMLAKVGLRSGPRHQRDHVYFGLALAMNLFTLAAMTIPFLLF